ncbi:DUF4833 domain-containing protein [Hymenobacter volaticus]|uniref:DUF4833 domain-containing protein n=1 Tax=Hymenobacter volaticus TaxID=2932254 RepID=UPI0028802590|nr:DUF4833 domain-containing protein [Hymenobacter volaticus]
MQWWPDAAPERVVLLGVSALACGISSAYLGDNYKLFVPGLPFHIFETMSIFTLPITVLAVLSNITAVSRLLQAKRGLALKAATTPPPTSSAGKKVAATLLLVGSTLFTHSVGVGATPLPDPSFPTPKGIANQLFYLQRDPNTNTVIYQLNVNGAGKLNEDEPIRIFWIRYAEQGQRQDLDFIQRKFAYGVNAKKLAPEKYELKFFAYGKIRFYLMRSSTDKAFHVYTTVANQQMVLDRIFLRIEGGTFWVPNVKYVELTGWNPATREPVVRRFNV